MQGGDGFHRFPRHAKQAGASNSAGIGSSSCADMNSQASNSAAAVQNMEGAANVDPNSSTTPMQLPGQHYQVPQGAAREQDQYMPIANVIRIMRRILPAHAKISDDAKETIQECVSEYISFITGEANDRCQREQRKTITAEDVLWAMGKLGFDDYVEPLTIFLSRYREMENERTSIRDPILRRSAADYGAPLPFPSYMPPPLAPMGDQPGIYDPMMLGGYYRDASGAGGGSSGSSSHNSMANFDPYAQFK